MEGLRSQTQAAVPTADHCDLSERDKGQKGMVCVSLVTIMKYPHSGGNQVIKNKSLLGLIILEISVQV